MDVFKMFKPKRKIINQKKTPFEIFRETFFRFLILTIGAFIVAFALECFMLPNNIIDGGVIGVSMMLSYITKINLGVLIFCLNLPFIFLALQTFGKMFVVQTFYSITILSIATNLFIGHSVTNDSFLAAIFGGIILGTGVGLILKNSASLDGTEILSIKLSKNFSFMSIGEYLMGFNLLIYTASGFMFGFDKAMYAATGGFLGKESMTPVESERILLQQLGPSFGKIRNLFGFIGDVSSGKIKESSMYKLKSLIPFQNTIYLDWILRQVLLGWSDNKWRF